MVWKSVGVLVALLALLVMIGEAQASTKIQGEVVEITGLNDLSATADSQARTGVGKIFAYGLMAAGVIGLAGGYPMTGGLAGSGGLIWAFVPRIVGSAMDNAGGAVSGTVIYRLSEPLQVVAGALGLRNLQDPIFWLIVIVMGLLLVTTRPRTPAVA